jgi:predicted membrane channel-forming protein YqfA (hemolysin III family)
MRIVIGLKLLGVTMFSIFWVRMYNFWKSSNIYPVVYVALGACLIQIFAKTFFSMSINDLEFFTVLVLGYCAAVITYPELAVEEDLS